MSTNKVIIAYADRLIELATAVKDPGSSAEDVAAMMYYCGIKSDTGLFLAMARPKPALSEGG